MINKVLESMGLIKHLHDDKFRGHGDLEGAFKSAEKDVLACMETLGKVVQNYTHGYEILEWWDNSLVYRFQVDHTDLVKEAQVKLCKSMKNWLE